jgi:2-polyprenyl-3-methyl-5-hydroxy-6-metoxy-1,4-benzoquinol methylase
MDMAELDFLITLISPGSRILEIGCSNGFITEYIHDHITSTILGIDFSEVAVEQAQRRTKDKSSSLNFKCINPIDESIPNGEFDIILLIDSIYFLGEIKELLQKLNDQIPSNGKMIFSIFQSKEAKVPEEILLPDHTFLAQALNELGFEYTWYDFTQNVRAHGMKNYQVAEELRESFRNEGHFFLYEARAAENTFFREASEKGIITRYMYQVKKKPLII